MANAPLRVVVWSTGGIGSIAISAVHRRPDMELVGVWVHSEAKVGRDAGELIGIGPIGVATTNDKDALIALRPDCVVYATNAPEREASAVPDYVRFLKAGINVVTTTSSQLIYPPAFDEKWRTQLIEATNEGNSSIYASGVEPGFACDHLPLMLTTQSRSVRTIRAAELSLYDDYPVAHVMMDMLGFGKPMDYQGIASTPGVLIHELGGMVRMIAETLGVKLDGFRESFDKRPTDRDLDVACGKIPAGTCGAIRLQCIGIVDGRDAIIVEHVNRMASDLAPDWPRGNTDLAYRIEIEGEPNIVCNMDISLDEERRKSAGASNLEAGAGAMISTAMRVVNAIPYVVAAEPGLRSALDLPLTIPRHAFDPA